MSAFSELYNRPEEVADSTTFAEHVKSAVNDIESRMFSHNQEPNKMLNQVISYDEVENVVRKLKIKKSCGIDGIPNEVLKSNSIILLLWKLLDKCFEYSRTPSVWLKSIISPIQKGDRDPYIPLNYRGISLLSTVSKVYTSVLNNRLKVYLEMLNLLAEEQNGFRKGRSCLDHAFTLSTIVKNRIQNKQSTFLAFIDMEKAFDWVDRELLMYKLLSMNIDGQFYFAIKSLYCKTEACIKLHDTYTDMFVTKTGVRQGDVLSPTLFNIYINDLVYDINELNCGIVFNNNSLSLLLYADDIVLLAPSEEKLQLMLDTLSNWCKRWQMKVNDKKSKVMHCRPRRSRQTKYDFRLDNTVIEKVDVYKYLGFTFDQHMTFNTGIELLSSSAGRALGGVISKFKNLKEVGFTTYTKLFSSLVIPVMDYFSGIWGLREQKCKIKYRKEQEDTF